MMTLGAGAVGALLLVGGGLAYWYERPTTLTVAVSRLDGDDSGLIAAIANQLKHERKPVRLHVVLVENASAASAAVDAGTADLAVVRTDVALPSNAQTVVILHRDAAIIAAPSSSDMKEIGDLSGHRIGILRDGPANVHLLETALMQVEVKPDTVMTESLQPGEVADAIRSKRVDAIMTVDVVSSPVLHDIIKAVTTAGGGPPVFIPVSEAAAIAQRSPAYESTEVVKGAFGGSPSRPADEFDTLSVTHRLMANENVGQDPITSLTRFLLSERATLGGTAPLARQIEAPSTDKGSALPVHAGAAAYIDDEEQTFFDKYSDMIYMAAMFLGVVASGGTALLSRMNAQKSAALEESISRLVTLLALARGAATGSALDEIESEADNLLASAVAMGGGGEDEGRRSAFGLVLNQVHAAIRDRRMRLPDGAVFEPGRSVTTPQAASVFAAASAAE